MREGHVDLKIMEKNAFNHYILITLSYIVHYITLFFLFISRPQQRVIIIWIEITCKNNGFWQETR